MFINTGKIMTVRYKQSFAYAINNDIRIRSINRAITGMRAKLM
jgi:hypothetical protein